MGTETFIMLLTIPAVSWLTIWIKMLWNDLYDKLEKVETQLTVLKAEFVHYKIDNPPKD